MYLGLIVERAGVRAILKEPRHPHYGIAGVVARFDGQRRAGNGRSACPAAQDRKRPSAFNQGQRAVADRDTVRLSVPSAVLVLRSSPLRPGLALVGGGCPWAPSGLFAGGGNRALGEGLETRD